MLLLITGKYAEMTCEFCCTSHHYCNSLKSLDTVITDCLSLSLNAADTIHHQVIYSVTAACCSLLVLLVTSYITVR